MSNTTTHILIVEDSPEDFEATVRVLRRCGLKNAVFQCVDGDDALDYLYRRGRYAGTGMPPRPGIILLDLNLPGTDGREVLETVKMDPVLRRIPVVILTGVPTVISRSPWAWKGLSGP